MLFRSRCAVRSGALPSLLLVASALLAGGVAAQEPDAPELEPDVPYVPTPMEVVTTMLEVAEPTARDTVYDLGSGDGRLVIAAAERYGATGVGVEIQPALNERARERAREAGVADRVRFLTRDLFDVDLRPATVLTLYLGRRMNIQLRPRILRQMRPGSRVVSHAFDMGGWEADRLIPMREELALVFLWVVPANVAGRWQLTLPSGAELSLRVDQRFQELRLLEVEGPEGIEVEDPVMRGEEIWLTLVRPGEDGNLAQATLWGRVDGDRIEGRTETRGTWRAVRTEGGDQPLEEWSVGSAPATSEAGEPEPSDGGPPVPR